ncbi:MAG: chromosome segregation protein, partial [Proteobacteria bacterium]|nr:chromosome segregation protein [Pseudomonadota bacterium]
NIIDAVRWVLGESKAAALRGESMQDVIFNGSTGRKPVGRASVELVFDNAQGRAAGQWSGYAEIAVKRVLERNGDSSYYINNLHVRRRDVIDLFLGTGLGPRAYAIIEQGMISRIIEAKPEDLRLFLEEAAGITKYKERRRETENRLSDTRENLSRVEDIRNELATQIVHLEAQAEIALQFRALQAELAERQNLLWLLKRNDARSERERAAREVERATNKLEAETASLRELERMTEEARSEHYAAGDALHSAQNEMFAANAEVARLEQELAHQREARQKSETRLAQLAREETHWREQSGTLEQDESRWAELQENARNRYASAHLRHEAAAERLPETEQTLQQAEAAAAVVRRELAQAEQQLRVEDTHRASAQRAIEALAQRRIRLEQDPGPAGSGRARSPRHRPPACHPGRAEAGRRGAAGGGGGAAVRASPARAGASHCHRTGTPDAEAAHRGAGAARRAGAVAEPGAAERQTRRLAEAPRPGRRGAAVAGHRGRARLGNGAGGGAAGAAGSRRARR